MSIKIDKRMNEVKTFIAGNAEELGNGSEIALNELEIKVAEFCVFMAAESIEDTKDYIDELIQIVEYFKKLAEHLNLKHTEVVKQINELDKRKKAAFAYVKNSNNGA